MVQHVLTECPRTQDLHKKLLRRINDVCKILNDPALVKVITVLMLHDNLLIQFQNATEIPGDLWTQKSRQRILDQGVQGSPITNCRKGN